VDLNHKAAEELAEMAAVWLDASLGYAREHRQRKLVWLLEALRVEIKLEDALLTLPLGEHLVPQRGSA
jgi:RNase P/RNase MRP subunit p30